MVGLIESQSGVKGSTMHVFCASETWLTTGIPDELVHIEGFKLSRRDRSWSEGVEEREENSQAKKGGGLICYVRNNLKFDDSMYAHLNCSSKDLEMQWVSLDFKRMRKTLIINVYRPPQGDYKIACKKIGESINAANLKDNAEIFLMGDFNINLKDRKSPQMKELEFVTSLWGLKAVFNQNTRLGQINGSVVASCIDNIFTNSEERTESSILDLNFSDHMAIVVKRKRVGQKPVKTTLTGRSYKNYDRETFQNQLLDGDWREFYGSKDPNICWDMIENKIRDQLDQMCPQKTFRVREVADEWVTNEILEEIKDKDRAMHRFKFC